jgi:hypothetical protein
VAGKVTVNGRLLTEGSVVFWPDPAKGNPGKLPATGGISRDGDYTLYTIRDKGVAPGWYKVLVLPYILASTEPVPERATEEFPDSPVSARYMDLDTTPLSIEVQQSPPEEGYPLKLAR